MKNAKQTPRLKGGRGLHLVLVTTPDIKTARQLAQAALAARLVACANVVPGLESHYWWQGKIETGQELLVLFKTTRAHLSALAKLVADHHPYDTPEFVVVPVHQASARYASWWRSAVA